MTNQRIKFYDFAMKRVLSVTEAARNFSDLINRAYYKGESTLLLRSGQPVATLNPVSPKAITGKELAEIWDTLPHLSPEEADEFAKDLEEIRKVMNKPPEAPSWD